MVRGAQEGTPGSPLLATGRREHFQGPPLVPTFLFRTKDSMKENRSKKKRQVPANQRLLPWGQAPYPSSNVPARATAATAAAGSAPHAAAGPAAAVEAVEQQQHAASPSPPPP